MSRLSDPFTGFRFVVEIGGVEVAGFTNVAGLEGETSVEEYREGGENHFVHKLPTFTKYPNVTLKRGVTSSSDADSLWSWHQEVVAGRIGLMEVSIVLRERSGEDRWRWMLVDAFPVKWSGTELDAAQNRVFVETVELAHKGVVRVA